jgi:hypothetical protein
MQMALLLPTTLKQDPGIIIFLTSVACYHILNTAERGVDEIFLNLCLKIQSNLAGNLSLG